MLCLLSSITATNKPENFEKIVSTRFTSISFVACTARQNIITRLELLENFQLWSVEQNDKSFINFGLLHYQLVYMALYDIVHIRYVLSMYKKLLSTHTHTFNGPLSGTTRVSRYQKGKTNLDFTEARDSEWQ